MYSSQLTSVGNLVKILLSCRVNLTASEHSWVQKGLGKGVGAFRGIDASIAFSIARISIEI